MTAGAPSFMPFFFKGSISRIHVCAASSAGIALPPVETLPSGSLNASTYEILAPLEICSLTSSRKVVSEVLVGAVKSIGTN